MSTVASDVRSHSGTPSSIATKKQGSRRHSDALEVPQPQLLSKRPTTIPPFSTDGASAIGRVLEEKVEPEVQSECRKTNPFTMPPEDDLFKLRERERRQLKEVRARERTLRVHEKGTHTSRLNAMTAALRKSVLSPESAGVSSGEGQRRGASIHDDTEFVLATTKERHIEKEDLSKFIGRKREMFLLQYTLGVKRDEIRKLEEIAKAEEKKLEAAEKYLEESATMFDEFLKENDKKAVEAIKLAEGSTKAKLERVSDIKKINAQLLSIRNEISRNNEQLSELKLYKKFLDELSPEEWRQQKDAVRAMRRKKTSKRVKQQGVDSPLTLSRTASKEKLASDSGLLKTKPSSFKLEEGSDSGSDDEDAEMYFKEPNQVLSLFMELEEQNLSLIQNSQETEESLEEVRQTRMMTEQRMNREVESLQKQIESLLNTIYREEEKAYDYNIKSEMFLHGEYKAEDQEQMLADLDKMVADVYNKCIGPNEANMSSLQMLTAIEGRMEELFETIEAMPPDKVEAAEKLKEKERRLRKREEKMVEHKHLQEERLRKALERAQADPKKRLGRKLVYRSEPPVLKRSHKDTQDKSKEEEELNYYFT